MKFTLPYSGCLRVNQSGLEKSGFAKAFDYA